MQTRTDKFNLKWNDFFTGLFKKHNQSETIQLLLELADEVGLKVLLLIILMEQSLIKPKTEPCFILHCVQVKQ
jgi:hypothetical protein